MNPSSTGMQEAFLPAALEYWAQQTPDAPALVFQDETITFAAMNQRVNHVAHLLLQHKASRTTRIGLCMPRGEECLQSLILLFGIVKVGIYIPLSPSSPPARLAFMLRDAQVTLVLTTKSLAHLFGTVPVLFVEDIQKELAQTKFEKPPAFALPTQADIAYIVYTTGTSKGVPDGVVVGHRSFMHFAPALKKPLEIGPGDRVSQFFSLAFDASLLEIMTLVTGATLYPVPAEALLPGQTLVHFLQENAITVATFTPSIWMALSAPKELPALRLLLLGGEACSATVIEMTARPGLRIFNAYGLTETTVGFALGECLNNGEPPPIGKVLAGSEVSVRDEQLRPVPPGELGELCVSGACLAIGYTDEEPTHIRFVADPLALEKRLFLTRDTVRMDCDGTMHFVERIDLVRRFKLPGALLVDLDEIETLLWQATTIVRECAVEAFDGRIVAYISLQPAFLSQQSLLSGQPAEEVEREVRMRLNQHLRLHCPDYMLPKIYVILQHMPHTLSNKIDRHTLRSEIPLDWTSSFSGKEHMLASTPEEQCVAQVLSSMVTESQRLLAHLIGAESGEEEIPPFRWEEVNVALRPYDFGIDSLRAATFALRIEQACGVSIELQEIYSPLTILAAAIAYKLYKQAGVA